MAFFDKITDAVKSVGDKAGDTVEIQKLNSKISKERTAIDTAIFRVGRIIYSEKQAGAEFSPDVEAVFNEIDSHNVEILKANEEIERIKAENEKAKAMAQARNTGEYYAPPAYNPNVPHCESCGAEIKQGALFCMQCGAKVPPPPEKIICTGCGAELDTGKRFCPQCGTPLIARGE